MGTVFGKNTTSSSITVAGHKVYYIDSTDAEIVEVEGQVGAISNTATIYIRGYKCGYDITLTQSGYENFSGVLACELKGVIYTNVQQTTTQTCNYSGNVTFTNGSGTVEVAPFSWTYYGDSITQHDCVDNTSVKYNAFKYTLSGTPYWYVIDGEHDTWTDDLSAWGYSEVQPAPVLPEVTLMAYRGNEWNYPASFNTNPLTFVSGEQAQLYIASGTSFLYESDKVYSVGEYQNPSGTTTGRCGFSVVSVNSKIGCENISGGSITMQRMSVYRCSDSTATVVTVYNSSNVAYNAFQYIAGGVNYYYVLDGIHDTWTDDLSAWGYSEVQPVVELPEVSVNNDFGEYNWLVTSLDGVESISANGNTTNLGYSAPRVFPSYDDTKSYGIVQWQVTGGTTAGRVEFSIVNASGKFQAHNNTNGTLSFYQAKVAVCSSNQATVITVYDSSNNAYNAFKYTANNTDYYYVLDGTQTDWTDDLSAWGYSEVPVGPVLPEVNTDGYILYGTSDIRPITIASGETHDLYEFGAGKKSFNTSKSYATNQWQQGSAYTRNNVTNLQIVNNSGYFAVKNASSSAITSFVCITIATCSDSTATVVTVYNSSNVAYNAFKFTANNVDYYYVLDGTQTDWTDDLAGIGYRLTPAILMAYLTSTTPHSDKYLNEYSTYSIVDSNNNVIPYDSTKTYTKLGTYRVDGTSVSSNTSLVESYGYLKLYNSTPRVEVGYVEYTVS